MLKVKMDYRVPYADTDQMGVVYYGNYLTIFERARSELMRACGYTYRQCEAEGWMLPVVKEHVDDARMVLRQQVVEGVERLEAQHVGVREPEAARLPVEDRTCTGTRTAWRRASRRRRRTRRTW